MDIEEINLKIAEYIRMHREKENWTIRYLERISGISRDSISRLEGVKGFKKLNPNLKTLKNLLDCFDKNLLDLFDYVYSSSNKSK